MPLMWKETDVIHKRSLRAKGLKEDLLIIRLLPATGMHFFCKPLVCPRDQNADLVRERMWLSGLTAQKSERGFSFLLWLYRIYEGLSIC